MIAVKKGDITKEKCDAMVNPVNSGGRMGGGVALAIRLAGGQEIEDEAVSKSPVPVGSAIATAAGRLNCKFVIHAPTMTGPAEKTSAGNVRKATRAALELACKLGTRTVAFPGMGTGTGGVDYSAAAEAMVGEMNNEKFENLDIILVAYNDELAGAFKRNLKPGQRYF